jgi:hypothetical protein
MSLITDEHVLRNDKLENREQTPWERGHPARSKPGGCNYLPASPEKARFQYQ